MRKAGVLLHISSLPGRFGCGTFGREAYAFADFLHAAGFRIWQVLPFNVPHRDASPYSSASTFAQNPLFIDPDALQAQGLLRADEVDTLAREAAAYEKDFYALSGHRERFLRTAAARVDDALRADVIRFLAENQNIKEACAYLCGEDLSGENLFYHGFVQYQFHTQWQALHDYLHARGIEVIGDIPIYADLHSSEVQYHHDCYQLNEKGEPDFVSGVPGDSFNDAGQYWGHPLYRVDRLIADNYAVLFDRMAFATRLYDITRIDHFQAILRYYAIPRDRHPREGHWEQGVGEPFLRRLADELGCERFVVEDFGCYQRETRQLAEKFGMPHMNVLQFTLSGGKDAQVYPEKTLVYTGTHDNDTFVGYLQALSPEKRTRVATLLQLPPDADVFALLDAARTSLCASRAERVIFPAQDLLGLGTECRMNIPGISGQGNWHWRLSQNDTENMQKLAPLWHQTLQKYDRLEKNL